MQKPIHDVNVLAFLKLNLKYMLNYVNSMLITNAFEKQYHGKNRSGFR